MSQSSKTALGGIVTALSVVLLIPTVLGVFTYALPAFAGMLIMFCVIELDKKWAFGIYAATSLLGLLLVPNKEAVVYYIAFFGYYPILKAILESKVPRVVEYILKFIIFNVSVLFATFLLVKVFGMPLSQVLGTEGETAFWVKYAAPIMLALGNVVFILFDFSLTNLVTAYLKVWQKRFRKLFPFK